jgi:hypothetical protein
MDWKIKTMQLQQNTLYILNYTHQPKQLLMGRQADKNFAWYNGLENQNQN